MPRSLPDFLIAGAPRCGTTWLYQLLDRHPQVFLARPARPEPKFFLIDELYARGLDHYVETWFADVPAGRIAGEKSTNYLESPTAARRIRDCLPEVKLVFILREPATRAYSNYLWSRMNGLETQDFATALDLEPQRERTCSPQQRYARPHAYFARGLYAELLEPYYKLFPRERILILDYDEMAHAPGRLASQLHAFLGIEPRADDAGALGVINASQKDTVAAPEPALLHRLSARYVEANRELACLTGFDITKWGAA